MERESPPASPVSKRAFLYLALVFLLPFHENLVGWVPPWKIGYPLAIGAVALLLVWKSTSRIALSVPAILFGGWIVVECLLASSWDRSFGLLGIWSLSLFLGIAARILTRVEPGFGKKLCLTLWISATFIAVVSPTQTPNLESLAREADRAGMAPQFKEALLHAASQSRYNFPFGNPIHLGLFLVVVLLATPVVWRWACRAEKPALMKLAVVVATLAQVLTFWGTKSRTPILALLAGCLVWVGWKRLTHRRTLVAGALLLLLGVGGLVVSPTGREMIGRVETVRARLIYWKTAAAMIRDAPLLGFGIGGFGDRYPQYRSLSPHQTQYPHNLIVEIMTDQGALGLVLFLFCFFSFRQAMRRGKEDSVEVEDLGSDTNRDDGLVGRWVLSTMAAFGVSALCDFPQDMLYLCGLFGALAGTGLGLHREWRPGGLSFRSNRSVCLGLMVALMVPILLRETGGFFFERAKSRHLERNSSPSAIRQRIQTELADLKKSVAIWPPNMEAQHFLGRFLIDLGDPVEGRKRLETALYWSPNTAYLYEDLATLDWDQGKREEALATLDRAVAKHPIKWNYHATKSRWLHELGKTEEALQEKRLADRLKEFEPDYLQARLDQASNQTEGEP